MLWRIVRACADLGIERIALDAYGGRKTRDMDDGRHWGGYYFWPSAGFDGPIADDCREFFRLRYQYHPKNVGLMHRVRDIFALPDGPAFWKLSGTTLSNGEFVVRDSAPSVAILRKRVESLTGVHS